MRELRALRHLTWNGRVSWLYYRVRRLFVAPAPNMDRCIMGYPIDADVRCPRFAVGDSLWCRRHTELAGYLTVRADMNGEPNA